MLRSALALFMTGVLLVGFVTAGEFNKKLNIGDPAPAWENLPGVDGKMHSLADLKGKDTVIVVFTCNSCPIAVNYEDRIIALTKKYSGPDSKTAVVAINVNVIPQDKLPAMIDRAKEKGFNFPYLIDESQKIAKDYGATYTPEFFVLDKNRKIAYMGAMDDANQAENVKGKFLEPAIDAVMKGQKPEKSETLARGCLIRFVKDKK